MKQRRITVTFSERQRVQTIKGEVKAREWLSNEMKRLRDKGWNVDLKETPNGRMYLARVW